jgi:protein-S-isoprenylcysteine O-methyltransferase Ste14
MRMFESRVPPPLVTAVVATGMYYASGALPHLRFALPARMTIAILFVAAGLGVILAGVLAFRHHRTTVDPLHPDRASKLVRDGIYRWTRNPMYLGMLAILCGWAIWLAHPIALAGPVLLHGWLTRFQIIPEERALRQNFAADFADYSGKVRRWL